MSTRRPDLGCECSSQGRSDERVWHQHIDDIARRWCLCSRQSLPLDEVAGGRVIPLEAAAGAELEQRQELERELAASWACSPCVYWTASLEDDRVR